MRIRVSTPRSYHKRWRIACSLHKGGRMKLVLSALVVALVIGCVSFAQTTVTVNTGNLQTGFAVITPVSGTGEGLSVSEIAGLQAGSNLFQTSLTSSPLLTLTDVVVSANPATGLNTGIAIANPNLAT